jgi:hypothetical protein
MRINLAAWQEDASAWKRNCRRMKKNLSCGRCRRESSGEKAGPNFFAGNRPPYRRPIAPVELAVLLIAVSIQVKICTGGIAAADSVEASAAPVSTSALVKPSLKAGRGIARILRGMSACCGRARY